jgi:ADP-heptose:LPS heptosyltransferase
MTARAVLVHVAAGIGNIVLTIPLLRALHRGGLTVDLLVDGDYPQTAELFAGWDILRAVYNGYTRERPKGRYDVRIAAVPPFYWSRFAPSYARLPGCVARPPDALFYRDERAYYLAFAQALGCNTGGEPDGLLPIKPDPALGIAPGALVLAPGCKTGSMAAKRWPHFPALAEAFENVVVVGTLDDLNRFDGSTMRFPAHARSLVGHLSLRQTASVLAGAATVVANDSGLGHVAAAVGAPTVLLFGPTPDAALGRFPSNVRILRAGLPCEPCWHAKPLSACGGRVDCLQQVTVAAVVAALRALGLRPHT